MLLQFPIEELNTKMRKAGFFFLVLFLFNLNSLFTQVGTLTGTGMSICNLYSFSVCPSQTITPLNYGNQGYACTGTNMPDVSFTTMGGGWRVMKNNWFFRSTVSGQVSGYNSSGILQVIPFSATNTITPLSYTGTFVQFGINGIATGPPLNQATFSISLIPVAFGGNSYTYCPNSSSNLTISPIIPSQGGPWTYNWQPGGLTGSFVTVNPNATTIYTVSAQSSAGCISKTTVTVNVTTFPIVVTSIPSTICSGKTATLTASGANSYIWSPNISLSSNSGSVVIANPNSNINYTVIGTSNSCSNTAIVTVSVSANPTLSLSSNTVMCLGASSILTVAGANSYFWTNSSSLSSSTGSVVTASPASTTIYTVTGITGICTNTSVVTVSVNPSPLIAGVSVNNTSCGLSNGSVSVTSSPVNSYSWSPGVTSNTNTANSLAPGSYTIIAINGTCQTSTVITILNSSPLSIISSTVNPSNCPSNDGSIKVMDNSPGSSYLWTPNITTNNTALNLTPCNYSLTISNGACSIFTVYTVGTIGGPTGVNLTIKDVLCQRDSGKVQINNVINGVPPYLYNFNSSGFSSLGTFTNLAQGVYSLEVKDSAGCTYTQTLSVGRTMIYSTIDLITKAPNCESDDGSFFINNIVGGTAPYLTSFNNTPYTSNMSFEFLSSGNYTLNIKDSNMCETGFILTMPENNKDFTLYTPNAFTPNDDMVNDKWYVYGSCLGQIRCLIYNRWGEKIIDLYGMENGWDGTYKGTPVPDGVYVYVLEVETKNGIFDKVGHITILR